MILGLSGFTIALQRAEQFLDFPLQLSSFVLYFALAMLLLVAGVYVIKMIRFPGEVKSEFYHPVKVSFFPTLSISLLLFSIALLPVNLAVSKYIWIAGTGIHFAFTLKIISMWMTHNKFEMKHMNPAWFIPAVGNIIVPIAGTTHYPEEISWFFFSVGLFFWIALFVIFFNRIIFHNPLPDKLLPTLSILIAPPAVGFTALLRLTGELGEFTMILYFVALFMLILLLSQVNLLRKIEFYLSWWAYSFPLAAITIASLVMYNETGYDFFNYLSWALLILLIAVILLLLVRTAISMGRKEICIEDD